MTTSTPTTNDTTTVTSAGTSTGTTPATAALSSEQSSDQPSDLPFATPRSTVIDLDALGWIIERDGVTGHESDVAVIARRAASVGVSPVLVGVLADDREPEVARIRAFGLVALGLSRRLHAPV